jgi:hypothetical protein
LELSGPILSSGPDDSYPTHSKKLLSCLIF